jgi:hypothetical protein
MSMTQATTVSYARLSPSLAHRELACCYPPFGSCSEARRSRRSTRQRYTEINKFPSRAHFGGSGDTLLFCQHLPQPAWHSGFTHHCSSVSAHRPREYSTPLVSARLTVPSLADDLGSRSVALCGTGFDACSPFVALHGKSQGETHFYSLLCLAEASRLAHPSEKLVVFWERMYQVASTLVNQVL